MRKSKLNVTYSQCQINFGIIFIIFIFNTFSMFQHHRCSALQWAVVKAQKPAIIFAELFGDLLSFFYFDFLFDFIDMVFKNILIVFKQNPRILGLGPQNTRVLLI